MRILLVNKFIFPKGGAETYTFDVGKMLEEHGHEVQYFGLENEKNIVGNPAFTRKTFLSENRKSDFFFHYFSPTVIP